jgi:2-C-methyl-D-erythritol 4-phosphate cytidylyltransferase
VFLRTLEVFADRDDVIQTLLVASQRDRQELARRFGRQLDAMKVELATGGETRSQSVRNALASVHAGAELICVHDAVRPCVSPRWIDAVFVEAARTGAAILAYPVHGTVKQADRHGVIAATLPQRDLWEAQTPQVFRADLLREAYAAGADASDDARLVEQIGHPVSLVIGDPRNIKITTPADLALAEAVYGGLLGRGGAAHAGTS